MCVVSECLLFSHLGRARRCVHAILGPLSDAMLGELSEEEKEGIMHSVSDHKSLDSVLERQANRAHLLIDGTLTGD